MSASEHRKAERRRLCVHRLFEGSHCEQIVLKGGPNGWLCKVHDREVFQHQYQELRAAHLTKQLKKAA